MKKGKNTNSIASIFTWHSVVSAVGVLVLVYLVFKIFTPILEFKVYIDWWAQYGGKKYPGCIDMVSLAYWQNFPLYYYIRNLSQSSTKKFESSSWVYFITSLMFGGAIGIVPDGVVTPRAICESIIPEYPPSVEGKKWPTAIFCPGKCDDDPWGCWKCLISHWGGVTISEDPKEFKFTAKWTEENPDNFFWNDYAMPIDSPMMEGFLTNWAEDVNGQPLYPDAILPLISKKAGIASSGWWGFLQQLGGNVTYNEIKRIVWADIVPGNFANPSARKNCGSAASQASSMMGGANMALAAGMLVGGGEIGMVAKFGIPLFGGLFGYAGSEASKGCTPFSGEACTIM